MSTDLPLSGEEKLQQLAEDNGAPADPGNTADDTHTSELPADDTRKDNDIDETEAYDAGMDDASGSQQPSGDTTVTDYNPPNPRD